MTDTFPEPPYDPSAQLGCPSVYSAAIHWRGGARTYVPPNQLADRLVAVEWERRLSDTSPARIVVGKASLSPECCGLLGTIQPWCHELTIFRDEELVWQGPITFLTETQTTVTIDALDVTAWLSRLMNTHNVKYTTPTDVVTIAREYIRRNLTDDLATPVADWPNMLPFLTTSASGTAVRHQRRAVWADSVFNIMASLATTGFEWTAVGRRLVMRRPAGAGTRARARLTPDDLPGGIQVSRDGTDAATRVFATSQTESDDGITVSRSLPGAQAVCGRVDQIIRDSPRVDWETEAEEQAAKAAIAKTRDDAIKAERDAANADLTVILEGPNTPTERKQAEARRKLRDERIDQFRKDYEDALTARANQIAILEYLETAQILGAQARAALPGRWPSPVGITVDDGARLSVDAPLTVRELVPGERVDVVTVGYCQQITQAMRLSRVAGKWEDGGEAIGVSLVPLTDLAEVDT